MGVNVINFTGEDASTDRGIEQGHILTYMLKVVHVRITNIFMLSWLNLFLFDAL